MADDTKTTNTPDPTPAASPDKPIIRELELPMMSWMKGGTVSTGEERTREAFMADTRQRWAEADAEKEAAKEGIVRDQGGNVVAATSLTTQDQGQPGTSAVAILAYETKDGFLQYQQVDVTMQTNVPKPGEDMGKIGQVDKTFVFVCPECIARGTPQTLAQLAVRDSNKKWDLDVKMQGFLFADENAGQVYRLAGTIECHERCRCPNGCGTTYTIGGTRLADGNKVRAGATLLRRVRT